MGLHVRARGFWQPLTWLSFQLDYSLWGLDPGMFHLTSLLLHAAAAVVFYHVAEELLGGRTGAALLAALFFAVHPLRVESVAWATERKGLLSGLFFLLAALGWLRGRPRLALAAFAASLAAKPMGSTLPFALLVVEAWRARGVPPRKTLLGLAPFFVLSAASVAATYLLARGVGLAYDIEALGPLWRVSRVIYGLAYYPLASLWPAGLSPTALRSTGSERGPGRCSRARPSSPRAARRAGACAAGVPRWPRSRSRTPSCWRRCPASSSRACSTPPPTASATCPPSASPCSSARRSRGADARRRRALSSGSPRSAPRRGRNAGSGATRGPSGRRRPSALPAACRSPTSAPTSSPTGAARRPCRCSRRPRRSSRASPSSTRTWASRCASSGARPRRARSGAAG
ncbi:MAG: hypothetical protein M0D55_15530 [Elusimicrobiota bacterium]|nr:MAG: hypothetical protein M0D55_15530 [Elusimicrobiota bacterium]